MGLHVLVHTSCKLTCHTCVTYRRQRLRGTAAWVPDMVVYRHPKDPGVFGRQSSDWFLYQWALGCVLLSLPCIIGGWGWVGVWIQNRRECIC